MRLYNINIINDDSGGVYSLREMLLSAKLEFNKNIVINVVERLQVCDYIL